MPGSAEERSGLDKKETLAGLIKTAIGITGNCQSRTFRSLVVLRGSQIDSKKSETEDRDDPGNLAKSMRDLIQSLEKLDKSLSEVETVLG
jgi:hypothetical protein